MGESSHATLYTNTQNHTKTLKLNLSESVYDDILAYCQYAGFDGPDELIEQIVIASLKKDKAWREAKHRL